MTAQVSDPVTSRLRLALIVDDHPLFCDALSMTLKMVAGLPVVETAGSLEEATARLDRGPRPDLVLLDLNLPDMSGPEVLRQLRLEYLVSLLLLLILVIQLLQLILLLLVIPLLQLNR